MTAQLPRLDGPPAYRAERHADAAALLALLGTYPPAATPCRAGEVPVAYWTSDSPAEQRIAAEACSACPLRAACALYGLAHRDEAGVYGGWTEAARRSARGYETTRAALHTALHLKGS